MILRRVLRRFGAPHLRCIAPRCVRRPTSSTKRAEGATASNGPGADRIGIGSADRDHIGCSTLGGRREVGAVSCLNDLDVGVLPHQIQHQERRRRANRDNLLFSMSMSMQ